LPPRDARFFAAVRVFGADRFFPAARVFGADRFFPVARVFGAARFFAARAAGRAFAGRRFGEARRWLGGGTDGGADCTGGGLGGAVLALDAP
jgi:hypothetical protein